MRRFPIVLTLATVAALVPAGASQHDPLAVVALIDTGVNPYSPAFRDTSALAQQHPSTYIPGYPADTPSLELSFDTLTLEEALAKDADVWEQVEQFRLYWIPGTKIVGAISLGNGGRRCAFRRGGIAVTAPPPASGVNTGPDCPERPILDEHGHGTSTASRVAGAPHSLAPDARLVIIEGLGTQSSQWAADAGWIDVQSNSWGFLTGVDYGAMTAFGELAEEHLVVTASGNGVGFSGFAPETTYTHALSAPGVVVAGGHDNGRVTAWSGVPPQVVADAYAPFTAFHDSLAPMQPHPVACCTSTAAPYVAGGAAAIIAEARRILGDRSTGVHDGVVARGPAGTIEQGPLADGLFTLDELRETLYRTAVARPVEGRDDGRVHATGDPVGAALGQPVLDTVLEIVLEDGPGQNPYCQGCWTLPVPWTEVPDEVPVYPMVGYGAVNEISIAAARAVLSGAEPMPARPDEDAFFEQDEALRRALWRR